jgi:hypothetical protein
MAAIAVVRTYHSFVSSRSHDTAAIASMLPLILLLTRSVGLILFLVMSAVLLYLITPALQFSHTPSNGTSPSATLLAPMSQPTVALTSSRKGVRKAFEHKVLVLEACKKPNRTPRHLNLPSTQAYAPATIEMTSRDHEKRSQIFCPHNGCCSYILDAVTPSSQLRV